MNTAEKSRKEKMKTEPESEAVLGLPRYTLGEEVFSAVSHGVSALFAIAALALLLVFVRKRRSRSSLFPFMER